MLKKSPQYEQLKEAMELIKELEIPEHLQEKALSHLLQRASTHAPAASAIVEKEAPNNNEKASGGLRGFIATHKPKGAVEEIPALLWWAQENEKVDSFNEDNIVALYRRGDIRPPKNVGQSMRDLSSKRYLRVEAVKGKPGHVMLSRVGTDFVLHDLFKRKTT